MEHAIMFVCTQVHCTQHYVMSCYSYTYDVFLYKFLK